MALKTCIECGKEHTDTIANCPHCGFVTKEHPSLKEAKNEKIDVEDIVQNIFKAVQLEKKSGAEGIFSTGHPLTNVFKVLGMSITTFIVALFFYKYLFAYIIVMCIFLTASFPYFYHKKDDNSGYKTITQLSHIKFN